MNIRCWHLAAALWAGLVPFFAINPGLVAGMAGVSLDPLLWIGCIAVGVFLPIWWIVIAGSSLTAISIHIVVASMVAGHGQVLPLGLLFARIYAACLIGATVAALRERRAG